MDGSRHVIHDLSFLECAFGLPAPGSCGVKGHAAGRSVEQFGEEVIGGS